MSNINTDFVTDEMCDGDEESPSHWVEAGIFYGQGSTENVSSPTFFWADQRPGQKYSEHDDYPGSASVNAYYDDYINNPHQDGNWSVYVGGFTGTSSSNYMTATDLQTGTEETTSSAYACNGQHGTSWWDTSFNYHAGSWPGATGQGANPPYIHFIGTGEWHDFGPNSTTSCYN